VIFLAEAFARPKTMYTLAKLGTTTPTRTSPGGTRRRSWRLLHRALQTEIGEYYRPSFWPNTPDILTEYLAHGGRPAHVVRFVLAATLSSVYGLYGPPYEHLDHRQHPKREEYQDNEKYEVRHWNWDDPQSLQPVIRRVNRIRRENPALHHMRNIRFHTVDNPHLIAYTKETPDNLVLCVVNLDPYHAHSGWVTLPLHDLDIPRTAPTRSTTSSAESATTGTAPQLRGARAAPPPRPHLPHPPPRPHRARLRLLRLRMAPLQFPLTPLPVPPLSPRPCRPLACTSPPPAPRCHEAGGRRAYPSGG
jgi:hypothetical protein